MEEEKHMDCEKQITACEKQIDKELGLAKDGSSQNEGGELPPECHNKLVCELATRLKGCLKKVDDPNYDPKPECVENFLDKLTVELVQISLRCPQKEAWCLCFLVNVHQRAQSKLSFMIQECPYTRWSRVKQAFIQKCRDSGELVGATELVTEGARNLNIQDHQVQ